MNLPASYLCPHCHQAIDGGASPCPHCAQPILWNAHCDSCDGLLEKLAACGSVSYFCPACNSLKSRRSLTWRLNAGVL